MDKEKIDGLFESFENRGLLKGNGSFYTGDSVSDIVGAYFFSLLLVFVLNVIVSCVWSFDGWRKIVFPIFLGPFLGVGLWNLWVLPSRQYWYRDRLVIKNFLGCNVREYSYSDISLIKRYSEYDEASKTYNMAISISFRNHRKSILIKDNPHAQEFFRTCFGDIFLDYREDVRDREYDLRLKFFARVLKRYTPKYHPYAKERQCAVRYFLSLKTYRDQGTEERYFTKRLAYWLRQCKRDTMEKCVEDCRALACEIMESKSMDYKERLELLTYFFECTYVEDGLVDEWELELLSQIAVNLEIQSWDFVSLKHRFEAKKQEETKQKGKKDSRQQKRYQQVFSNRKQEAYSLLKLNAGATLEEVKRAYRTQVKSCHPDMLPPTVTDREKEEATVRFRSITEAYDFLCLELSAEPVNVSR